MTKNHSFLIKDQIRAQRDCLTARHRRSHASMGDSGQDAICFYLQSTFEIETHEIPDKIEAFTGSLEEIFGADAKLIEISIIEARHERVYEFKYFPKQEGSYSPRTSLRYVVSCAVLCGVFRE